MKLIEKLKSSQEFKRIAKEFKRIKKGSNTGIEDATRTGSGRIGSFEKMKYNPGLWTFLEWCRYAGVRVELTKTKPAPKPGDPVEEEDPGKIIDEIRNLKNQKSESDEH